MDLLTELLHKAVGGKTNPSVNAVLILILIRLCMLPKDIAVIPQSKTYNVKDIKILLAK